MKLFIAVIWYLIMLLMGINIADTDKKDDRKADKAEIQAVKMDSETNAKLMLRKDSKIEVWEEDEAQPLSD